VLRRVTRGQQEDVQRVFAQVGLPVRVDNWRKGRRVFGLQAPRCDTGVGDESERTSNEYAAERGPAMLVVKLR
jgi:hypothetical protein